MSNAVELTITSDCQCWDCSGCGVGYVGVDVENKCADCKSELKNADNCFGCWTDVEDSFYEMLNGWRERVGIDSDHVRIEGSGMGWTGSSGYAIKKLDKALEALTIRGDFRIEVKWEGRFFSARRYSHDEPTGSAVFRFKLDESIEE